MIGVELGVEAVYPLITCRRGGTGGSLGPVDEQIGL